MDNYINIKIGNKTYIQRNEFSKLLVLDNNTKTVYDNISSLSKSEQQLITDAIKIQKAPQKYFNFEHSGIDEITIKKYIGTDLENIVVPSKILGKNVKFAPNVFRDINIKIKKIVISDGIDELPEKFCLTSTRLEEVYLSSSITKIPFAAFTSCIGLKYINLDNIKEIDNRAFEHCENLDNINLEKVESIGINSFFRCALLSSINLPNLMFTCENAFNSCRNLKSVTIGNKLQCIESGCFEGCINLTKVNFPKDMIFIGDTAFKDCVSLEFFDFSEKLVQIGESAFENTKLKGKYLLPKNLKTIKNKAFINTDINRVYLSKKTKFKQDSFPLDALLNIKYYEDKSVIKELNKSEEKNKDNSNR